MKAEDTICYQVDGLVRDLKKMANKRGTISPENTAYALTEIKEAAQHMENALKLRKKIMMSVPGLEESYQAEKERREGGKHIPGINKVPTAPEVSLVKSEMEITVKKGDEIVYQKKSVAGVICTVEEMNTIGPEMMMEGETQTFKWGSLPAVLFAFDQLNQSMESYQLMLVKVGEKLKQAGKLSKEEFAKKMNELLKGGDKK